jgi:hypothetical protein
VAANYNAIIASHVAKLTEAQLEDKRRDERKRSMLSRLSPEQAALFKLISARDWEDYDPVINPFTTKLIEDKDLTKAIDTIASELRRWPGQVSHRQLAAFLSGGYAATDVTKSPGGFTLFMFRPKSARFARSPEEERNAIRSMFGETKLDDESVRFYSKKDFFLAGSLPELEEQLRTAIEFLSLLTCERGIAVAGYNFGLRFLLENRPVFLEVIERRPIFCTEYAYMLDNVFQSFLYKLGRFYLEQNPIREARQLLKSYQRKSIEGTMRGFEYGAVPQLRLPSSLTSSVVSGGGPSVKKSLSATAAPPPSRSSAKEPPKDQQDWWTRNTSPETSWLIPKGKAYGDFFDPGVPSLKPNLRTWPKIPHHSTGMMKPLCIKYQSTGRCWSACGLAHILPGHMDPTARDETGKRFVEVYS